MGIEVKNGGLLTTIQDLGRIGYQQFGVPASGVMDTRSFKIANILVGNENEAVLEMTIMGGSYLFKSSNIIAVTGGDLTPKINGKPMPMYEAVLVNSGDLLTFVSPKNGCRTYLAVAGGFDIPMVMGSCSTYLKAKIGGIEGRKLKKGDILKFKNPKTNLPNISQTRSVSKESFEKTEVTLRVVMGPQNDLFTPKGVETFLNSTYTVTQQFDRMGCRLDGNAIEHLKDANIISDGISFGAIQIPGEGKPIIMLADRQTTGGYTKIANVISVDLPLIAQCKSGDKINFKNISVEKAQNLFIDECKKIENIKNSLNTEKKKISNKQEDFKSTIAKSDIKKKTFVVPSGMTEYNITLNGKQYDVTVISKN